MVAQLGRSLILKRGNASSPEVFTIVGGLRDTSITINEQEVDVTSKDDAGVRQLLAGNILKSLSVSGSGVFKDDAIIELVRDDALAGTHSNYQLVIPGTATAGGIYEGAFRITSMEEAGSHDGEVNYSLSLESDGTITFTNTT